MKSYKFEATIQDAGSGGAYVIFPYDVEKEFATTGKVPVQSLVDGEPYTGSLLKCGTSQHLLGIVKAIRKRIGKAPGDTVQVEVWKDEGTRDLDIPAPFAELLARESLLPAFQKLSFTHRKEYCDWIAGAKKQETQARRLQKSVMMLKSGIRTPG